jgi:hypothetical protein
VVTNIAIIGYYSLLLSGICRAAFYGVGLRELPVIGLLLRWARPALPVSPQD